ncbi:MAG: hypothetical protein QM589_07555 [Thermomicrobiales bacterium]
MVWKRLFRQHDTTTTTGEDAAPTPAGPGAASIDATPDAQPPIPGAQLAGGGRTATSGSPALPPHMQRIVQERHRAPETPATDPRQRLARLQQQRLAILFDVDQGELAEAEENPWTHRIALLTEAMDTVTADLATLTASPPAPSWPVPPVPITDIVTSEGQSFTLALRIASEPFAWEESLDWAERGHQISLPELHRTQGRVDAIVPPDAPAGIRNALAAHLDQSLDAFAEAMREHRLNGEPLPEHATLADLAKPSPDIGGWLDWNDRSPVKAVRAAEDLRLRRERDRLLAERGREVEERHRLIERLPIARRRLADVDAEIAAAEAAIVRDPGTPSPR